MMRPLVSVIMRTYNQEQYIGEAIESVIGQSYANIELIVVDDGSTDETPRILERYGARIKTIPQPNSGRCQAGNTGIKQARGEYIAFLDSDDRWDEKFIETAVHGFETHPECSITYTGWIYIDETGSPVGKEIIPSAKVIDLEKLLYGAIFPINAALVRRSCFNRVGAFDLDVAYGEDWFLWLKFAAAGFTFIEIDRPLAHYRRHNSNTTANLGLMQAELLKTLEKIFSIPAVSVFSDEKKTTVLIFQLMYLAQYAYESNDLDRMNRFLEETVAHIDKASMTAKETKHLVSFLPLLGSNFVYVSRMTAHLPGSERALIGQYFFYSLYRKSSPKIVAFLLSLIETGKRCIL